MRNFNHLSGNKYEMFFNCIIIRDDTILPLFLF